ncbi:MAG: response regulator [Alphaproteobacteria bacterium]|nr:response regulator [Alphaproteobacteria bacterium]
MDLEKILYAEDDPDIQTIGVLALENLGGFTVKTCDSGVEVLSAAIEFQPDLVILDIMMPGMDGIEALRSLRDNDAFQDIPVIFMTAKVMKEEQQRYEELGALGVIAKPFDPVTLGERVHEIWRQRNA